MIYNGYPLIERPPSAPLNETLSWAADMRKANSGREERISLRGRPRMLLRVQYPIEDSLVSEFNALINVKWDKWLVPCWALAKPFTPHTDPNQRNIITFNSDNEIQDRGFKGAQYVIVQNYFYTHVTAFTINGAEIDLTTEPDWTINYFKDKHYWSLIPVHFGQVVNNRGFEGTGFDDTLEINYDIDEPPVPSITPPPLEITGTDGKKIEVLTISSQDDIKEQETEDEDKLDFQLGKREIIKDWARPEKITNYHRVTWLDGVLANYATTDWRHYADDVIEFRKFLHRRQGRSIAFLEPTFRSDVTVTAISGNSVTIKTKASATNEIEKLLNQSPFLCFRLKSGNMAALNITNTSITIDPSTNMATLNTLPANSLTLEEIEYCSLATISRLLSDSVEFIWEGNQNAICSVRFAVTNPTREATGEGVVTFAAHFYIGESEFSGQPYVPPVGGEGWGTGTWGTSPWGHN